MARSAGTRRGRPAKPEAQRKRSNLTFRVRDQLRDELRECAEREGRSVSEEIEQRLERSLIEDELLGNGNRLRLWGRELGAIVQTIEEITGKRAFGPDGDPLLFLMIRGAADDFFDQLKPPGDPRETQGDARTSDAFYHMLALTAAVRGEATAYRRLVTQDQIDQARDRQHGAIRPGRVVVYRPPVRRGTRKEGGNEK